MTTPIGYGTSVSQMAWSLPGQWPASATNDSAAVGYLGEYLSTSVAVGSGISLSSNSATTVTSLALTPGDWDVWGQVIFNTAALTVVTLMTGGVNTSAAQPTAVSGGFGQIGLGGGLTGIGDTVVQAGPARVSLASAGTAYLMGTLTFTVSTAKVYGVLQARRQR